jgi:hypothetical protein
MKTYEEYLKEAAKWLDLVSENKFKENNEACARIADVFIYMAEEVRKAEKRARKKQRSPHYI